MGIENNFLNIHARKSSKPNPFCLLINLMKLIFQSTNNSLEIFLSHFNFYWAFLEWSYWYYTAGLYRQDFISQTLQQPQKEQTFTDITSSPHHKTEVGAMLFSSNKEIEKTPAVCSRSHLCSITLFPLLRKNHILELCLAPWTLNSKKMVFPRNLST